MDFCFTFRITFKICILLSVSKVTHNQPNARLQSIWQPPDEFTRQKRSARADLVNYYKREKSLPDSGNIWDHFVLNLKCNASYPMDWIGVLMFELKTEDGVSNQDLCEWNFLGSKRKNCTAALVCPKTVNFDVSLMADPEICTESYLTLSDGTRGKITGCHKFTFQNKPRIPRNGGTDLYVSFKGITEARNCLVFCIEDLKPEVTGLNKTTKIGSNKEWKGFKMEEGCMCGRRREKVGRVVGGKDAEQFEFPWLGSLVFKEVAGKFGPNTPYCGGSIINDRWFLTAGHCVARVTKEDIQVVLHNHVMDRNFIENPNDPKYQDVPGWNLPNETDQSENRIRLNPEKIIRHPLFDTSLWSLDYDVALIKFKTPLDLKNDDRVSPICLPQIKERFKYKNGDTMVIAGWGYPKEEVDVTARIPQKLEIAYLDHEECFNLNNTYLPETRHICAGVLAGGKDSCNGDSGGPLIYKFDGINYIQSGISSTTSHDGCGRQGQLGYYTDVQEVVQWIYKHTKDATWCPRKRN